MDTDTADQPQSFKPRLGGRKLVLVLALVLLVGAAGAAGWWQQQEVNKLKLQVNTLQTENTKLAQELIDLQSPETIVAKWPEYVSATGQYRVSYKPDWLLKVCEGNESTVFMAPDKKSQAICNSEKGSPISVSSYSGDQRTNEAEIPDYGTAIDVKAVTVSEIIGKRIAYTHRGNEFVAKDTKQVSYEFYTSGRTYIAVYSQAPDGEDLLAEFELVAKSLKFSAS